MFCSAAHKLDTPENYVVMRNLSPGKSYELYVKAGNENGTSQLEGPLQFSTVGAGTYFVEKENGERKSRFVYVSVSGIGDDF